MSLSAPPGRQTLAGRAATAAVVAGALLGLAWVFFVEPSRLEAAHEEFLLPGLGGDAEGIRLAFFTDLHFRRAGRRHERLLREIEGFRPDLLLLGGDYHAWLTGERSLARFLSRLGAPQGVFAVQGNWEYKVRRTGPRLRRFLQRCGIRLLINESVTVALRGASFVLLGMDDAYSGHADFYSTFRGLPKGPPRVLLTHSPQVFRLARRWGVSLMLSGHTHGGQLVFPFVGPLWLPPGSEATRAGRFRMDGTWLYVSRGIGTSIIPARLRCPPEVVLITLRNRPGSAGTAKQAADAGPSPRPGADGSSGPAGEPGGRPPEEPSPGVDSLGAPRL